MTDYHRIDVTVDAVIFRKLSGKTEILLIRRKHEPYAGCWAIPGGFVDEGEDLKDAAIRELEEETGLIVDSLEQLHTFGQPDRDPRKRIISVVHWKVLDNPNVEAHAADDASEVRWFSIDDLPELAFDHAEILEMAFMKLNV